MKLKPLLTLIVCLLVLGGGVAVFPQLIRGSSSSLEKAETVPQIRGLEYYTPNQFQQAIEKSKLLQSTVPSSTVIRAAIFPHDLARGEYVIDVLKQLQAQQPSTIVLIGPNHYELGPQSILTANVDWTTPYGTVMVDRRAIHLFTEKTGYGEDAAVMQHEHAINGILPYLSYYLPDTKILPLILKSEVSLGDIEALLPSLEASVPADAVYLASVDFSHYLASPQAEYNDQLTARALTTLDYSTILSFGTRFNDYVDSPPSIALLLSWLERHAIGHSVIANHTNSGFLNGDLIQPVTSYFEVLYY
jgi:MEMO1 family protein